MKKEQKKEKNKIIMSGIEVHQPFGCHYIYFEGKRHRNKPPK